MLGLPSWSIFHVPTLGNPGSAPVETNRHTHAYITHPNITDRQTHTDDVFQFELFIEFVQKPKAQFGQLLTGTAFEL